MGCSLLLHLYYSTTIVRRDIPKDSVMPTEKIQSVFSHFRFFFSLSHFISFLICELYFAFVGARWNSLSLSLSLSLYLSLSLSLSLSHTHTHTRAYTNV